jgi:hypothetical protein
MYEIGLPYITAIRIRDRLETPIYHSGLVKMVKGVKVKWDARLDRSGSSVVHRLICVRVMSHVLRGCWIKTVSVFRIVSNNRDGPYVSLSFEYL